MARTPETATDPAPATPVTVDTPEWAGVYWTAIEWLYESQKQRGSRDYVWRTTAVWYFH